MSTYDCSTQLTRSSRGEKVKMVDASQLKMKFEPEEQRAGRTRSTFKKFIDPFPVSIFLWCVLPSLLILIATLSLSISTWATQKELISRVDQLSNTTTILEQEQPFVMGPPGPPGRDGQSGIPGQKGERGETGLDGLSGVKGDPGITGPPGHPGLPGVGGIPGDPGRPGLPGLMGLKGAKGDQGAPGPRFG